MVNGLREWATSARLIESAPFSQLEHRTIGIEAEAYIDKLLTDPQTRDREPLLSALGGIPFTIDDVLTEHLAIFKEAHITPMFVFNGLRTNTQQLQLQSGLALSKTVGDAWDLYVASDPERAVTRFGTACLFRVGHIYRHVQDFFAKNNVDFLVAPYSACAQLASIEGTKAADALAGTTELLLFQVERAILDFDMIAKQFLWISRSRCIEELGLLSPDQFLDACLFAGCSFLPTLPPLADEVIHSPKTPKIRTAADLLLRMGVNGNDLVLHYRDHPAIQALDYCDQYRRALMAVRYHVVISENGRIEPFHKDACPNDVHAFIGQHLPDELLYYLSRGIVGPRVLLWRTSGELIEAPPLDGGIANVVYQRLVRDQLNADRTQALSLLSYCLHRFYQHNNVTLRYWFDMHNSKTLSITDTADPKVAIAGWNLRIDAISERARTLNRQVSSLAFAIESLRDPEFSKQIDNVKAKVNGQNPLTEPDEVRCNALWRYLQLRGYVEKNKTLSARGTSLAAGLETCKTDDGEMAEAAVLAVELLRLKLLTADNMFPSPPYHGAPFRGSAQDQKNTLLVSRVACLGRLEHKAIGYTGPLSRHLLAYQSIVSAVRHTQRDLIEMSLCSMLLTGVVDRRFSAKKLRDVSFGLPFLHDVDCALAIAVKHYLDELSGQDEPTSRAARDAIKIKGREGWFPHAVGFEDSLAHGFAIWDAVMAIVRAGPEELVSSADKQEWKRVDEWLRERR